MQAARWLPVGLGVGFGGWGCRGWVFLGAAAGHGVFGAGPGFWVGWRSAGGGGGESWFVALGYHSMGFRHFLIFAVCWGRNSSIV